MQLHHITLCATTLQDKFFANLDLFLQRVETTASSREARRLGMKKVWAERGIEKERFSPVHAHHLPCQPFIPFIGLTLIDTNL